MTMLVALNPGEARALKTILEMWLEDHGREPELRPEAELARRLIGYIEEYLNEPSPDLEDDAILWVEG